jgi:transposase
MLVAFSLEDWVPVDHPLRTIRRLVDESLQAIAGMLTTMYSHTGRQSIPPERLIRALLLQVLYTIRSERQLVEQLDDKLLYRWFVGLGMDEAVWDASRFTRNCQRLIDADASQKSFQRKDGGPPADGGGDFRGQRRSNDTHASVTDPEAPSYRKAHGKEARLAYLGDALMDNRHGLAVDGCAAQATGTAERDAAAAMIDRIKTDGEISLGTDKGYDAQAFVEWLTRGQVLLHIAQNTTNRRSAVSNRVARTPAYAVSQLVRKRIEEIFGWAKEIGGMAQTKFRGRARVDWRFTMTLAAYNLMRIPKLVAT